MAVEAVLLNLPITCYELQNSWRNLFLTTKSLIQSGQLQIIVPVVAKKYILIYVSQLLVSRMPKMCAIPQLVSAPLNPIPIAEHFRRSHPPCEVCFQILYHVNFYSCKIFPNVFLMCSMTFIKGVSKGEFDLNFSCLLCSLSHSLHEIQANKNSELYVHYCELMLVFFFFVDVIQGPCWTCS